MSSEFVISTKQRDMHNTENKGKGSEVSGGRREWIFIIMKIKGKRV